MERIPWREMRRIDANAVELGIPVARLMGAAGKALAQEVLRLAPRPTPNAGSDVLPAGDHAAHGEPGAMEGRGATEGPGATKGRGATGAWFVCGKGNNGGDGFAAAALVARQGTPVHVVLAEPEARPPPAPAAYLASLPKEIVAPWEATLRPPPGTILVDCLLGSGTQGPPRPPYDAVLDWLGARRRDGFALIACDVPSGLPLQAGSGLGTRDAPDAGPAKARRDTRSAFVVPDATVTFHRAKEGMTRSNSGRIIVADIGIPREAIENIGIGDLRNAFRASAAESHKGDNGRVLIVAGGPFTGAAWYSAMGAARTGADLVHVAAPADAARAISAWGPTPLVHATEPGDRFTKASVGPIGRLLERVDAVVVGPGVGTHPETEEAMTLILAAVASAGTPLVVDADGLDAVTPAFLRRHGRRTVLTPHRREFMDLAHGLQGAQGESKGKGGRTSNKGKSGGSGKAVAGSEGLDNGASDSDVVAFAKKHKVTVLRKGRVDLVTDGRTTRFCHCGHPTMTVGGTGDVLTGITASLLARKAPPFDAACAATYVNGSAGEIAGRILGPGAQATDVHEAIPSVLMRL